MNKAALNKNRIDLSSFRDKIDKLVHIPWWIKRNPGIQRHRGSKKFNADEKSVACFVRIVLHFTNPIECEEGNQPNKQQIRSITNGWHERE